MPKKTEFNNINSKKDMKNLIKEVSTEHLEALVSAVNDAIDDMRPAGGMECLSDEFYCRMLGLSAQLFQTIARRELQKSSNNR